MITIREGSSLYYSLLWTDALRKQQFVDRLTLIHALSTTLDDVQDPQVAERKIHWWHEELQRMISGQARHPATQLCQDSLRSGYRGESLADMENDPGLEACLAILSSVSTSRYTPPATDMEADSNITRQFLGILSLLCQALSNDPADLNMQTHCSEAALALGKHDQLLRLPARLHRGQPVFSTESYQSHDLSPADLAARIRVQASNAAEHDNHKTTDAQGSEDTTGKSDARRRQLLLSHEISNAQHQMRSALADENVSHRYRREPFSPIWFLLLLRERQLSLWQRKQPDLLRERMSLTPVRKFMTCWSNRRHIGD